MQIALWCTNWHTYSVSARTISSSSVRVLCLCFSIANPQPFVQLALAGLLLLEFVRTFLGFSSVMTEKRIEEGDIDP